MIGERSSRKPPVEATPELRDVDPRTSPPELRAPELTPRRLLLGLLLLTGLAIGGLMLGTVGRSDVEVFRAARTPDVGFLTLGLVLAAIDILIGALRILTLCRPLNKRVSLSDCVRAELANRCVAGITPWHAGGGGAQVYMLARAGVSVPWAVALGSVNFLVSTIVLLFFGFLTLAFLRSSLPPWLQVSTRVSLALLIAFLALSFVVLVAARRRTISRPARDNAGRLRRWIAALVELFFHSIEATHTLLENHRTHVFLVFPITIGIFVAKIAFTWAVFRAFEPVGHLDSLFGVLVVLLLALFFSPTPGASGLLEASATAFLTGPLGSPAAIGFVLTWRTLTLYLPVVFGGIVLLHQLGRDSRAVASARVRDAVTAARSLSRRHSKAS
jgi:hypothetical protein